MTGGVRRSLCAICRTRLLSWCLKQACGLASEAPSRGAGTWYRRRRHLRWPRPRRRLRPAASRGPAVPDVDKTALPVAGGKQEGWQLPPVSPASALCSPAWLYRSYPCISRRERLQERAEHGSTARMDELICCRNQGLASPLPSHFAALIGLAGSGNPFPQ